MFIINHTVSSSLVPAARHRPGRIQLAGGQVGHPPSSAAGRVQSGRAPDGAGRREEEEEAGEGEEGEEAVGDAEDAEDAEDEAAEEDKVGPEQSWPERHDRREAIIGRAPDVSRPPVGRPQREPRATCWPAPSGAE